MLGRTRGGGGNEDPIIVYLLFWVVILDEIGLLECVKEIQLDSFRSNCHLSSYGIAKLICRPRQNF